MIALILGQDSGQFGAYRLTKHGHRVALRWPRETSGWSLRMEGGVLYWWPSFQYWEGHAVAIAALEEIIEAKLEYSGSASRPHEVLGPLGLAALRAHLTTTVAT